MWAQFAKVILAMVSSMIADQRQPVALEGTIVAGSWNAADATADVLIGDTYSNDGSDGDAPIVIRAHIATGHVGDQYGPVGNERVTLHRTQGDGYVATFEHGEDDTPAVPSGERHITHKSATGSNVADVSISLLNNGQPGDSAGGIAMLVGVLLTLATAGGLKVIASDLLGYIEVGNDGLDPVNAAAVRKIDLDNALTAQAAHFTTQLATWAATSVQHGTGASGPTLTAVTSSGSTKVKIAN